MKHSTILIIWTLLLTGSSTVLSQNKMIDAEAIRSWPNLTGYGISNDGKYIWYVVESGRVGGTLFITDAAAKRKVSYAKCYGPKFSNDNKNIFFTSASGIYKVRLHDFKESFIKGASNLMIADSSRWMAYKQADQVKVVNIEDGDEHITSGVSDYLFDPSGNSLLIKYQDSLCLLNLANKQSKKIFSGCGVENTSYDRSGDQLLFSVVKGDSAIIFRYSAIENKTEVVLSSSSPGIRKGILLSGQGFEFNKTANIVYFKYKILDEMLKEDSSLITPFVDIWAYKDRFLQSEQIMKKENKEDEFNPDRLYRGVLPLGKMTEVLLLENADTSVYSTIGNEFAIVKSLNNDHEVYWRPNEWPSFQLVSLKNGIRTNFLKSNKNVYHVKLSPSEKFITWADTSLKMYYCYNIQTGNTISLTSNRSTFNGNLAAKIVLDGWLEDDVFIICHDAYDLWQVDPQGVKEPICLTAGYGRLKKMKFAPIDAQEGLGTKRLHDEIIVAAMEDTSMNNGFFKIKLSSVVQPKRLIWGPYLYYFPGLFAGNTPKPPLKARNSNLYLIQRQSDKESLNLFLTHNFIELVALTNIHPEENYNWYQAKLIRWATKGGEPAKGVLYFPSNLDTTKNYPILFNYYEIRSGELRRFHTPDHSAVNINIPVYLNKGYLVFVPDIPRKTAHTFENALDIIESGAMHLTNIYKWIDKSKMGLQGQSFGGTVTNFVATHSKLFAAAQASSGRTDFISCYGGLGFGGKSLQATVEVFQNNLGYTPWDRPDVYINNSSIFGAGNTQTPLLIAHGTDDVAVNIGQAVELFTALRRAGKKVWFLQYSAGHVMDSHGEVGKDFMIRQQQFFDHYLKGMPAPEWMTKGIPTRYKGIKSGLLLDSQNIIP